MLLKLGVDISKLSRVCRRALAIVDKASTEITGHEAVITSTYDGLHSPSSLHYNHNAFDVRLPTKYIANSLSPTFDKNNQYFLKLRSILKSIGFDVVKEKTHIHIEYDPK